MEPTNITRRFQPTGPKAQPLPDLASLSREQLAARYAAYHAPAEADRLLKARGDLVRLSRINPKCWPGGIDMPLDRWYRAGEWADDGTYLGPQAVTIDTTLDTIDTIDTTIGTAHEDPIVTDDVQEASPIVTETPPNVTEGNPIVTLVCEQCGKETPRASNRQRFCSEACKAKASRAKKGKP